MPWEPLPLSYAIAIYPFQPSSSPAELPLQVGDQLYVIEQGGKDGAWCRGYLMAPPSLLSALSSGGRMANARVFSGIFPKCCIEIREELGDDESARAVIARPGAKPSAPVPMLKVGDESPTSSSEPLVDEISSCLREWYVSHLPDLVLRRQYTILDQMSVITTRLDYARRELLNDVLTAQERASVQNDAVWDLVRGNRMLGAEIIVRDPYQQGRLLTGQDSAIQMAKLQSVMSLLSEAPVDRSQTTRLHHCVVEINSTEGTELDNASITLSLYQKDDQNQLRQFSESCNSLASAKVRTLLADLSSTDIGVDGNLYLVVKVAVTEPPRPVPKPVEEAPPPRPPSRNGTVSKSSKGSLIERKRSSLIFGSKRKTDRPNVGANGRITAQGHRAVTPSIPEEPTEEEATPKVAVAPVPRTVGVGMLDIASIIRAGKDEAREVRILGVAPKEEDDVETGTDFMRQLLPSANGQYVPLSRLPVIKLDLKPHEAPDADSLIQMNPTSMHQISKTQKMGFSEAPTKQRSDIYLTLSTANVVPGGQLSHPELGSVPITALAMPNLQLTMELRDGAGKRLEHCIFASSNSTGVTAWRTHAIEAGEAWNQTICIRVPLHKIPETHLVLSVADAPEFPFALAWLPLCDKQMFLQDGKHSLALHAYDKTTSTFSLSGQGAYLSLPWSHSNVSGGHDGVVTQVASLDIETRLCSTLMSQNQTLVSLFNWRNLTSPKLMDTLAKMVFVPEMEIVKQLNEVLDALFAVLDHKAGSPKFEDAAFNDIVFVLGILHDRRFNLGPLVDRYADEHFKAPPVAACLVRSWTRLLQSISDAQSSREMRALFKVGQPFIKLLTRSYLRQKEAAQLKSSKKPTLREDMQAVLFGLQMMMRNDQAALIGSKTLLVQNFHSWLPELLAVYESDEVVKIAINFVDACEEVTGKLTLYKLLLIQNYTRMDQIWAEPKNWKTLVRHCLRWLEPHWQAPARITEEWREQIRLCSAIVAQLAQKPIPLVRDFLPAVVSTYCMLATVYVPKKRSLNLLYPSTYPFTTKPLDQEQYFDEALLELSALLPTLSNIEKSTNVRKSVPPQATNIHGTLDMLKSLLSDKACPTSWLSLHIHYHFSAIEILIAISNELTTFYLPEPEEAENFDMELWKSFFETILMLVSSPALTLESFSEQKRRAVWKIAGDVRQSGADLLRQCWGMLGWEATTDDRRRYGVQRLGGYQVQYVPSLVGPIIELCLSMHEGMRRVAVEILQTMIVSEWGLSEDLDLIETEVVGALNNLLKDREGSVPLSGNEALSRKLFVGELLDLFGTIANQPDDALWTTLEELVATIEELIDLLSSGEEVDEAAHMERRQPDTRPSTRPGTRPGTVNAKRVPDIPDRSISRMDGKVYGMQALEVYKQLADEYERTGDHKRLARTHRAIARIHEARANNQMTEDMNGGDGLSELDEEESR